MTSAPAAPVRSKTETLDDPSDEVLIRRESVPPSMVAGRYRVISKIAEGGMGAVYVAEHALSRKKLALKILHPHLSHGRQAVERFKREVSAAAEIDHPGIVQVFDAGVDNDGSFYMAMELLKGESLGERTRRDWPGTAEAVRLVTEMCEPLSRAHAKGFVHRDLKPDNVFVAIDDEGRERVKLLDFGLAREVARKGPTISGITFGTPEYMSPEQAMSAKKATVESDVWSVGVMLYELLSGQHPFTGETPNAVMANAIKEPHPPLSEIAPHVPAALAAVVERCLEKDLTDRPRHAGELADALREVTSAITLDDRRPVDPALVKQRWDDADAQGQDADAPVSPRPRPSTTDGRKAFVEKRPLWPFALVVLGLIVVAALALATLPRRSSEPVATPLPPDASDTAPAPIAELEVPPTPAPIADSVASGVRSLADRPPGDRSLAMAAAPPGADPTLGDPPSSDPTAVDPELVDVAPAEPIARAAPRRGTARAADAPSHLEEARACLARHDTRCAVDVLREGSSAAELELLVDLLGAQGRASEARSVMQRYVRRYPRGERTESYQRALGLAGE